VPRRYRVRPLSRVAGRTQAQATFSFDEGPGRQGGRRQGWGFWKPSILLRNRRQTPGRSDVQSSGVPATLARLGTGHHALVGVVPSGCLRVPRLKSSVTPEHGCFDGSSVGSKQCCDAGSEGEFACPRGSISSRTATAAPSQPRGLLALLTFELACDSQLGRTEAWASRTSRRMSRLDPRVTPFFHSNGFSSQARSGGLGN
jgi:hypothetical protein